MSRVDARFKESRVMVASRRTTGKALNCKGLSMNRAVSRMRTEKVMEKARPRSISHGGMGRISTTRIATTPRARTKSPWRDAEVINFPKSAPVASVAVVPVEPSAMSVPMPFF